MKRVADILVSAAALVLLAPVLAAAAIAVVAESGWPPLFAQWRVGRRFRRFRIYKFRSMQTGPGTPVTAAGDRRITRVGRLLRRTKIDELPQFWNVLRGDMSLVGPRPEVPPFVDAYRGRYERLLQVRPGLTDLASIEFRDEERLLAEAEDPVAAYLERVLPAKLDLAERYVAHRSAALDIRILLRTAGALMRPGRL